MLMQTMAINCHLLCLVAVFLCIGVDMGSTYPSGPPSDTCVTLFPHHGAQQQTGQAPYQLTFSPTAYSPGQNVTVTLTAQRTDAPIKGFQVTVHRGSGSGNTEEFMGTFTPTDSNSQAVTCLNQPRKMWGHTSSTLKTTVSAIWTAPTDNVGDLTFYMTVVEQKPKFWYKIPTALKTASTDTVVPPATKVSAVSSDASLSVDWTACGQSKGCWLVPVSGQASCSGPDCQAALSYRRQGDRFVLEMAVKGQDSWIALGLSEDQRMGDDQTMACTANTGLESVQLGYNPATWNDRQIAVGLSNLTVGQVNGQAICTFTRDARLTSIKDDGSTKSFDLNNDYYLFLAWGDVYDGTDALEQHHVTPAISSSKLHLGVVSPSIGSPIVGRK